MGRSPEWTPERKEGAIKRIIEGVASGMSVRRCLNELDDMPASSLFWGEWHFNDEDLQSKVAHAREAGVEVHLEEAVDIAEDGSNDWMEKHNKDGNFIGWQLNGEHVLRSKLRIETRLKRAAMIAPRKYGTKIDLTTGGKEIKPLDAGDAAVQIAGILASAKGRKDDNG